MRIVLDTNVLISGLISPHGIPAQLLNLVLAGDLVLLLDDRIWAEYWEVASRPKFSLPRTEVVRVLEGVAAMAEHVVARPLPVILPDEDDLPFLEVAVGGRAEALVTGNPRHFGATTGQHRVRIAPPREVLDVLRGGG